MTSKDDEIMAMSKRIFAACGLDKPGLQDSNVFMPALVNAAAMAITLLGDPEEGQRLFERELDRALEVLAEARR